jgi:predicted DNA-binding protein YlxM (UPF0122 family)
MNTVSEFLDAYGAPQNPQPVTEQELRRMHDTGDYSISDLAEVFSISRPTVYRTLARQMPNEVRPTLTRGKMR